MARRLDLEGMEALLDGGSGVELAVDGGDAEPQVGMLVEPEVPRAVLVLEVTDVDLSRVEVGLEAFPDGCREILEANGIYDVANNEGWVNVGDNADTAEFAVASIRRWWNEMGRARFPDADRLLITADGGGSNGYRLRAWKTQLAALAAETGLRITVCHYPPGTSKWNRIEHRMFSFITINWRGRPLETLRTVFELISATTTETGLTIHADHDPTIYERGVKITNAELAAVPLHPHDWHGEWNYTINAQPNPA